MLAADFKVETVRLADVPVIADLSADAFETDRHTQMKTLGSEPFDMRAHMLNRLPDLLKNQRCVVIKAIDAASGEIFGFCTWGFVGLARDELLVTGCTPETHGGRCASSLSPEEASGQDGDGQGPSSPIAVPDVESDPIKRLEARTDADLQAWMAEVMSEDARCLYVVGLSVSPKHQGRGFGSALLRWGIAICDESGAFAWVHSSESAWRMYQKSGFQIVRSLEIDLDAYAPAPPPPSEGPGAKWGCYVFRYLKYIPRK